MEFLTDHMLDLRLTEPKCMNTGTDSQHDLFARQLSALEKLLVISHSRLSLDDLYKNLKLVLKAGNKGMLKVTSIDSLIECVELYKTVTRGDDAQEVADFFDDFLKEVAHLARVKDFYHNTIYHCLYEFFYYPTQDNPEEEFPQDEISDEEEEAKSDDEAATDLAEESALTAAGRHEAGPKVTAKPSPVNTLIAQPVKRKKKKKKSKLNLLDNVKKKKKRRPDNRAKVLEMIQREKAEREANLPANQQLDEPETGREFEKLKNKTDKQRLAFTVGRVFEIQSCWNELVTQGRIPTSQFDEDSLRQLRPYKNYLPFEAVFRLVPDILVKGFKLVEHAKIWYNCARRLGGMSPACHQAAVDFFGLIRAHEKAIESLDSDIEYKKGLRVTKQSERKLLVNQILRFDEVKEKYEHCVEKERELKDYYKQLKAERNSEYPKLEQFERHDPRYKEVYDQIQYLADSMKGVYRELQTASYELELVKQDYTVGMGNQTNLVHMQNDAQSQIKDIDNSLPLDEEDRLKRCTDCERVRLNIGRMWTALYKLNADELLSKQAEQILEHKYSQVPRINTRSNIVVTDSDDDTANLEEALDHTLTADMDHGGEFDREQTQETEPTSSPETPPPPLPPPTEDRPPAKPNSTSSSGYNPSTAGIVDEHEAKEYRQRVERLKKKFELDLSGLKTTVDCHVDVPVVEAAPEQRKVARGAVQSGDEADMESDPEDGRMSRPQSKKFTKRNPERYSPLSDASDDYIYQQKLNNAAKPAKTVYILKKSDPREPPFNKYTLKTVHGASLPPQNTMYRQQKVKDLSRHPKPHERRWGNDYETLQALDNNFMDSLSVYKKSPMTRKTIGNSLTPLLPLEHSEGVFTPNIELSDGDISIDSGTGNSLDSSDDDKKAEHIKNSAAQYKHKPRVTVREQIGAAKAPPNPVNKKQIPANVSRLPRLEGRAPQGPAASNRKGKALHNISPTVSKSSPESLESRPIFMEPRLNKAAVARTTLHAKKPFHPLLSKKLPETKKPPEKVAYDNHPLAPTSNTLAHRKPHIAKVPKSIKPPIIVPRKQVPRHARMIESTSDDDIDEIFKQSTVQRTLPPKPSVRVGLLPPQSKPKRKYGIRYSLGKVQ